MTRKPLTIKENTPNFIFKEPLVSKENLFISKQAAVLKTGSVLYNVNQHKL